MNGIHWLGIRLFVVGVALSFGVAVSGCGEEFKCSTDYDCDGNQVCNVPSGQCEQFVCDVNSDCAEPGATCTDNACIK